MKLNVHVKIAALALIVVGARSAGAGYKYLLADASRTRTQIDTTDARGTKGRIAIGVDNWIGYFPLCSDEMRKRMRSRRLRARCEDDKADYAKRFAALKSGELQFAVATVDAYLLNGAGSGISRRDRRGDRRVQGRRRDRRVEGQGRLTSTR